MVDYATFLVLIEFSQSVTASIDHRFWLPQALKTGLGSGLISRFIQRFKVILDTLYRSIKSLVVQYPDIIIFFINFSVLMGAAFLLINRLIDGMLLRR